MSLALLALLLGIGLTPQHTAAQWTSDTYGITYTGGNVGIGTASDNNWGLDLNGTLRMRESFVLANPLFTPAGSKIQLFGPDGGPGMSLFLGDGSGGVSQRWDVHIRDDNGHLRFFNRTANSEILKLTNSGVSIAGGGGARLAVNGSMRANGDLVVQSLVPPPFSQGLTIDLDAGDLLSAKRITSQKVGDAASLEFQTLGANDSLATAILIEGRSDRIKFYNGDQGAEVEVMRIDSTGNVGIGTGAVPPPEKLSVEGRIIAEEVVVKLAANWPDYVFSDEYDLPTLEELDAYIRENNHLPGVPSAGSVEAEGLQLGATQAALLEKIEEMVLHTIRQEKELDMLKNQVAEQQKQIEALIERLEERPE